jgi:hypothetical protein
MDKSANIFFIRTTRDSALTPLETTAVLSAAIKNPEHHVWLLSPTLDCSLYVGGKFVCVE